MFKGWNELKLTGKLPERRSYHVANLNEENLIVFGGQDLKEGSLNSVWKLNIRNIIK